MVRREGWVTPETWASVKCFIAFSALIVLGLLLVNLWPAGPYYIVISSTSQAPAHLMELIGSAGGVFVREGAFPGMAIAFSTSGEFAGAIMNSGAALVLGTPAVTNCGV
ncbi:hypothetical protein ACFSE1_14405 [Rhizobium helianthi]|uniref:Uncharacterized protein n=1 Tax=Rhizobium helianthi TaxID=1132695 RepID=A0ABW4M5E5_9HYPH